jgi:hypothetical protein
MSSYSKTRKPLLSRPLDAFYFTFLVTHFSISILIDMQPFYPTSILAYFPKSLLDAPVDWLAQSGDFLVASLDQKGFDFKGRPNEFLWFWALCVGLEG